MFVLDFSGYLFYMHIKEKINGTVYYILYYISSGNDGVNELAINPFTEEDNKDQVMQEVKYGHLRVKQMQKLQKISKYRVNLEGC